MLSRTLWWAIRFFITTKGQLKYGQRFFGTYRHHPSNRPPLSIPLTVCLQKAVSLDPSMAEIWANIGKLHEDDGRLSEAMAAYQVPRGWAMPLEN